MSARMAPPIHSQGLVDTKRLRKALKLIRESGPKGITRDQLCKGLGGVSLRTVDRAIALMENQGAVIERVRRGNPSRISFVLGKGPSWDEHITSETRLALRLAMMSLAHSGTLAWQSKLEALEDLASERMSTHDKKLFEHLKTAVRVQGGVEDPIESPEVMEPLLRALEGRKEIEVEYQSAGKAPSLKTVVPYALTHDLFSGGTFLLAFELARRIPLHLRLNRISRVKVGSRMGVVPEEVLSRAATYQIGGWTSSEPPFQVEARIRGAHWIQAFKEAPPALPDFEAVLAKEGAFVQVRFKANHLNGASRWLLQFGPAAEVLAPPEMRDFVAIQLREAAAQYP